MIQQSLTEKRVHSCRSDNRTSTVAWICSRTHTHIYIYIQLMNEWWLVDDYIWIYGGSYIYIYYYYYVYIYICVQSTRHCLYKKPGYLDLRLCPLLGTSAAHRSSPASGPTRSHRSGESPPSFHPPGPTKTRGDRWIFQISSKINIKPIRSVCRWPYIIYIYIMYIYNVYIYIL